jgi:formiminotetrahydrofolate cyclodeaminase
MNAISTDSPGLVARESSLWERSGSALLELVAAPKPVPGGGSVAVMTACLGTALVQKAFAISLVRTGAKVPLDELIALDKNLRACADLDAAGYDDYVRAVRLPRSNAAEQAVREKVMEEAIVRATSIPIHAVELIHGIVLFSLRRLSSVDKAVVTDAIAGIRLLNASAQALLDTAQSNLKKIANTMLADRLTDQCETLRQSTSNAELELTKFLS